MYFIPQYVSFGGVHLHVTSIKDKMTRQVATDSTAGKSQAKYENMSLPTITIEAFLQGVRAKQDLAKLRGMFELSNEKTGKAQSLLMDGKAEKYLLSDLSITHQIHDPDFYELTLSLTKEKYEIAEHDFFKAIRNAWKGLDDFNTKIVEFNETMQANFLGLQQAINNSPLHSAQQIISNFNSSLTIIDNFQDLLTQDIPRDIAAIYHDSKLLEQRLGDIFKPKPSLSASQMATIGASLSNQDTADNFDQQNGEEVLSTQEAKLVTQLKTHSKAVFVQNMLSNLLENDVHGSYADLMQLRHMLMKLIDQLQKQFQQNSQDSSGRKMSLILGELANHTHDFFAQRTADYQRVTVAQNTPLIIFAWQNYGEAWQIAMQNIKQNNHFQQADIIKAGQEILIPSGAKVTQFQQAG